ncbi:hypothetical protein [Hyphococcus sp. DH-69]|uniref:hypothetical protein n=1 Tax=Hyphococcus formosus TaxID=3143534 RepID=UPI00398AFBE2
MRIVVAILIFLAGCGAIGYSYIAAFVQIAAELEATQSVGGAMSIMMETLQRIASGDIPQATGFLYFGALLIAFSFVYLIGKKKTNDR